MTLCAAALVLGALPVAAQQTGGLNAWLNTRIDSLVAMRIAMRDGTKQVQVPVGSASGASLVDRAALPDVMGIAVKLPNQPATGGALQPTTTAVSATGYLLLALARGRPLDPNLYLSQAFTRRVGVSVVFDTDSLGKTSTFVQGKVLLLDRGNPLKLDTQNTVSNALSRSTDAYGRLKTAIQNILFERVGKPSGQDMIAFLNSLAQQASFRTTLMAAGASGLTAIDRAIEKELSSFEALRDAVGELAVAARRRPQFAIGFSANATGSGPNHLRAVAIFDLARRDTDITLNAVYEFVDSAVSNRTHRLEGAGQVLVRLTPDNRLDGRAPLSLTIAASAGLDLDTDINSVFKVQAKLLLPIAEGVNVPVSATWASRTDLIDEATVKGQLGFSFDIAQLFGALR